MLDLVTSCENLVWTALNYAGYIIIHGFLMLMCAQPAGNIQDTYNNNFYRDFINSCICLLIDNEN